MKIQSIACYGINLNKFCAKNTHRKVTPFKAYVDTSSADAFVPHNATLASMKAAGSTVMPYRTMFFRDNETLTASINSLRDNFPNGAQILDYACSTGEEAVSILSLLGADRDKFEITGIDIHHDVVKHAQKNEFWLETNYFDYMSNGSRFKELFEEVMEVNHDASQVEDMTSIKLKNEFRDKIKFEQGDIKDINSLGTKKPVGAVFLRNVLYQLFLDKNASQAADIANEIIDKVYDKLEPEGLFVLGETELDWKYSGDNPIVAALKKDGLFEPIFEKTIKMGSGIGKYHITAPTVWKKVG